MYSVAGILALAVALSASSCMGATVDRVAQQLAPPDVRLASPIADCEVW